MGDPGEYIQALELVGARDLSLEHQPILELGQAIAVDWSESEYFSDRSCLTRSSLALLAENPAEFERYWYQGISRPSDATDSKDFGTHGHLAILEPDAWERRLGLPIPPKPAKGKNQKLLEIASQVGLTEADLLRMIPATTEAWKSATAMRDKLVASIPDRIDVTLFDYLRIHCLVRSVWAHPQASTLLRAPGPVEQTIIWREPTSGLLVKVRADKLADISGEAALDVGDIEAGIGVADIKTTRAKGRRAPWLFARSVRDYGYHVQNAMYLDAVKALYPGEPVEFYFIAVCSDGDFETSTWRLPDEAIEQGREIYKKRLLEICEREFTYDWRHDYTRGVQTVPWSYRP